jgi:hypothetical protein
MTLACERHDGNGHGPQRTALIAIADTATPPARTPAVVMAMPVIESGDAKEEGSASAAELSPANANVLMTLRLAVAI